LAAVLPMASGEEDDDSDDKAGMLGLDFAIACGGRRRKSGLLFLGLQMCCVDSLLDPPVFCQQRIPGPPRTTSRSRHDRPGKAMMASPWRRPTTPSAHSQPNCGALAQ